MVVLRSITVSTRELKTPKNLILSTAPPEASPHWCLRNSRDHPSAMCLAQGQLGPRDQINSFDEGIREPGCSLGCRFGGYIILISCSLFSPVLVVGTFSLVEGVGKLVEG